MDELRQQIRILEERLNRLESGMSYDLSESIKDRIFLPQIGEYGQESILTPPEGESFSVPAQPSGTIPVEYKGKIYKLLYE